MKFFTYRFTHRLGVVEVVAKTTKEALKRISKTDLKGIEPRPKVIGKSTINPFD